MQCLQWLDELHCYVRHSLMRFEREDVDEKDPDGDGDDDDDSPTLKRLAVRREEIGRYAVGRSYGRKRKRNEHRMTFRWQRAADGVVPRFKNLKDEMLNNEYCRLSVNEWNEVWRHEMTCDFSEILKFLKI